VFFGVLIEAAMFVALKARAADNAKHSTENLRTPGNEKARQTQEQQTPCNRLNRWRVEWRRTFANQENAKKREKHRA
jgi:hypothetical protein